MIGRTLAHYEVTGLLGKGGMGEVYRAHDTKLGREVALKILPQSFARDPERVARFEREARTLASIQHANIASIYGFEHADGERFLVMELVEGLDLAQRLKSGPLPVDEGIEVGRQIALGVEAAHEKGIVHRDLKPANIKLGPDGHVKILDFGLARAYADEVAEQDLAHSPTITAGMTALGTILGTAAYMSPEQARGRSIDRRTDLWAFGCVLHEMLTGDQFFAGESLPDSIGAILHKEIDLDRLPATTPPSVRHLIRRCLVKDPQRRMRDAGQARIELELARDENVQSDFRVHATDAAPARGRRSPLPWILLAVAAGVVLGFGLNALLAPAAPAPAVKKFDLGVRLDPMVAENLSAAVSPDGRHVAFVDENRIWLQSLDALEPRVLPGTEGALHPFWSPRSDEIAYFVGSVVWKIAINGTRPTQVCGLAAAGTAGIGGSWDENDRIVFTLGSTGIYAVSGRGGEARILVPHRDDESDLHEPHALPGARGILFVAHRLGYSPHDLNIHVDGERRLLFRSDHNQERLLNPVYDPSGHVLVHRLGGNVTEGLWAFPFSLDTLELTGEPFLVAADASSPSVARDGTLAFVNGRSAAHGSLQLAWYDRAGRKLDTIGGGRDGVSEFAISPDGRKIALRQDDLESRQQGLWVIDLDRGSETRITHDESYEFLVRWMPSSNELTYFPFAFPGIASDMRTMIIGVDGSSAPRVLLERGTVVAVLEGGASYLRMVPAEPDSTPLSPVTTRFAFELVRADGSGEPETILAPSLGTFAGPPSPDEQWLLVDVGDEMRDTFVTRLRGGGRRWRVTVDGGTAAIWDPRGDRIYYMKDLTVMEVSFDVVDGQPRLGRPEALFEITGYPIEAFENQPSVAISPDGERFLAVDVIGGDDRRQPSVKIVQNWSAEFR